MLLILSSCDEFSHLLNLVCDVFQHWDSFGSLLKTKKAVPEDRP